MKANKKFIPREMMEEAIKVMQNSIDEPRGDGKKSPYVGAVLVKPNGKVETAFRGELRHGDHAEYTLIERKNKDQKLDGSILFVTLEPCAPGARTKPKLSCAERIVNARIKEVYIGIEDPDPTVSRQGIKFLQDNGIIVNLFDRDLQEIIREKNEEFLLQAEERASENDIKRPPERNLFSQYEEITDQLTWDDLSPIALTQYKNRTKIPDNIDSLSFKRRLFFLGFLKELGGEYVPTPLGFLVFGNEPRNIIHHAGLLCVIHYPNGEDETREFNEPLILIPEQVENWLKDKLPNIIDRSHMVREGKPALSLELVREGLVNALVHRDYDIEGAKCQLSVSENTIVIKSPGNPVMPITLEQMQSFTAPMLSRNPKIHYVFAQMQLAEEQGFGLTSFKKAAEKLSLPLPTYSIEGPYLILTLYRANTDIESMLPPEISKTFNSDERLGWQYLATQIETTKNEYSSHMGFDDRKSQRHLKKFVENGLLQRVGTGPATKYRIIRR